MGLTHLEIHEGQAVRIRCQSAVPTDPDTEYKVGVAETSITGDIYFDTDINIIYIKNAGAWVGLSTSA